MFRLILFLLGFIPLYCYSQETDNKFAAVDSFARTVKYKKDLIGLTNELTQPYPDQLQKARAIFRWITENIAYDYKFVNKYADKETGPKAYKCKGDVDCEAKRIVWEIKYIDKVLKKKIKRCARAIPCFLKRCVI